MVGKWTEWTSWTRWTEASRTPSYRSGALSTDNRQFLHARHIGYWLCAKRLAHKRGGVRHGAGAAGLADVAVDPDAFKHAEAEKD